MLLLILHDMYLTCPTLIPALVLVLQDTQPRMGSRVYDVMRIFPAMAQVGRVMEHSERTVAAGPLHVWNPLSVTLSP